VAAALVVAYFASRLFHLTLLPIYVDESVHIAWALKMVKTGHLIGITDAGKFVPIWMMSLFVPLASDLLWTERLVSVGIGVFGLVGCYLLGRRLFGRQVGLVAAGLYLITPFIFFYDRMAMVDGLLTVLAIYAAFFGFELVRSKRVGHGIGLGLVLALAVSTKLSGGMLWLLPLVLVVGGLRGKSGGLPPWKWLGLAYAIGLIGLAPLVADSLSSPGFVSSPHWMEQLKKTMVGHPNIVLWQAWLANAGLALQYLTRYVTPVVLAAAGVGGVLAAVRRRRDELVLSGMAGVVVAVFVFTSDPEIWDPRYLLPAVPFVLLVAARVMTVAAGRLRGWMADRPTRLWAAALMAGLVLLVIVPALWFDYWLVVDPVRAPFVVADRRHYLSGEPSGYGLREAADFLRGELLRAHDIFLVAGKGSPYWNGLDVYLYDVRDGIHHVPDGIQQASPEELVRQIAALRNAPLFVLLRPPFDKGLPIDLDAWPYSRRVAHFDKPDGEASIDIYRVSIDYARE